MTEGAVLVALVALIASTFLPLRHFDRPGRRRLIAVLAVAFIFRLAVAMVLHFSGAWQITGRGAVTPDEAGVDLAARLLVKGDPRSPLAIGGSLHTSWLLISWSVYRWIWNSLLAIKLLNVVLGTVLVVPAYLLGRRLHSEQAALRAAWLVALFPNAVVWSSLGLREPLIALVIALLLLLAINRAVGQWRSWLAWVGGAAACLVGLSFTRSYMSPLLMVVLVGSGAAMSLALRRPAHVMRALAGVGLAVLVVLVLPTGTQLLRSTVTLVAAPAGSIYNPLSDCSSAGSCSSTPDADPGTGTAGQALPGSELRGRGAGSSDLSTSLQSVHEKGVIKAFAVAVLAGRPVGRSAEFFVLLQPGVVLWWTALPMMLLGAVALVRFRRWEGVVVAVLYPAAVVVFLAYTGQFIRHHYMIEPIGLVAVAIGWEVVRRRAARRTTKLAVTGTTAAMGLAAVASVAVSLVS